MVHLFQQQSNTDGRTQLESDEMRFLLFLDLIENKQGVHVPLNYTRGQFIPSVIKSQNLVSSEK